jgi:hypothetical protein
MAAVRSLSTLKLVALAGALGAVAGIALSVYRSRAADEHFSAALDEAGRALPTADFRHRQSVDPLAPDPESLAGIPPFPDAAPRRLSKATRGQGSPMAISWFETPKSVDEVISFYEVAFSKMQVVFSARRYNERSGYASYFENPTQPETSRLRLVSAIREGESTVVMISNLRPLELLKTAQLPSGIWLPAMANPPQLFELNEVGSTRFTVLSLVPDSTLASVEETFRDTLSRRGWVFSDRATGTARVTLEAKKGHDLQTISMTQEAQGVRLLLNFEGREVKDEGAR